MAEDNPDISIVRVPVGCIFLHSIHGRDIPFREHCYPALKLVTRPHIRWVGAPDGTRRRGLAFAVVAEGISVVIFGVRDFLCSAFGGAFYEIDHDSPKIVETVPAEISIQAH